MVKSLYYKAKAMRIQVFLLKKLASYFPLDLVFEFAVFGEAHKHVLRAQISMNWNL